MIHTDRATVISGEYSPSETKGIVGHAQMSIGTSYHFLLFSLSQNIPALALYQDSYYKQKLKGLTKMYSQSDYCLDLGEMNSVDLLAISNVMFNKRAELSSNLSKLNRILSSEFSIAHKQILKTIK
ncbi:MAG: polysaccharide pyruvyl transferase family protein [Alcanivoracaceae bacterium]|nr:polysaccharide pyruvyl transferase family protein [Alcanivoracaceae bacterium]